MMHELPNVVIPRNTTAATVEVAAHTTANDCAEFSHSEHPKSQLEKDQLEYLILLKRTTRRLNSLGL